MEKVILKNGTEIAVVIEALRWLRDTDKSLVGQDRTYVEELLRRLTAQRQLLKGK